MNKLGGNLLQDAEGLLREGKRQEARPLLVEYIHHHPASARGWWMLSLAETDLNRQIDGTDVVRVFQDHGPFDGVLKLTHVARPVVAN